MMRGCRRCAFWVLKIEEDGVFDIVVGAPSVKLV